MIMNSRRLSAYNVLWLTALAIIFSGALAPNLHAQINIGPTAFTSSIVCQSSNITSGCQVATNVDAIANTGALQLTTSSGNQVGSAWAVAPQTVANGFTSTFTFQFTNPSNPPADGIAFLIQNASSGLGAIGYSGGNGGAIGYGDDDGNGSPNSGISNSLAVEFDSFLNGWDPDANHVAVQSCGTAYNTSHHGQSCSVTGGGPGSSTLGITAAGALAAAGVRITDGKLHTATIQYNPPGTPCNTSNSKDTNNLCIYIDQQNATTPVPALTVPVNLSTILTLGSGGTAFVGFTGATGGDWETQDILSWTFQATVVQTFNQSGPTTSNFSANGSTNTVTLDTTQAPQLICNSQGGEQGSCGPVTLVTTNTLIPNTAPSGTPTWAQFVVNTPWATSSCAATPANGSGGNSCSLFVNQCYGGNTGTSSSQADDFYCPQVTSGSGGTITLADTFDPSSKVAIQPGTTVSFLDFTPSAAGEPWTPSTTSTNSICNYLQGSPSGSPTNSINPLPNNTPLTGGCDVVDSIIDIFGDQTTTRGSKPKKGTLVTVFNVPMLLSTVEVVTNASAKANGCPLTSSVALNNPPTNDPNYAANIWNNGSCLLDFDVFPAKTSSSPNNNFQPAPPASLFWGKGAPVVQPGPIPPTNDTLFFNPNPNCSAAPPSACNPSDWDIQTENAPSIPLSSLGPDGSYVIHWSASDVVGISEKNIQLIPKGSLTSCYNPDPKDNPNGFTPPCFNTSYFTTLVNVDSAPPQGSCAVPNSSWNASNVTLNCSATDATSGILSATTVSNITTPPTVPVPAGQAALFSVATNVSTGQELSNAVTGSEQLCDYAQNCASFGSISPIKVDMKAPVITVSVPSVGQQLAAYSSVQSSITCTDMGSGVASCNGTSESGGSSVTVSAPLDTKPNGPGLTAKTFTAGASSNTFDEVGNVTNPAVTVNYNVSCHYASVTLSSTTLKKGISFNPASTMLTDCMPTTQKVIVELALNGPFGKSCATSTQLLFFPIPVTIPANTNKSPLPGVILLVPANACSGSNFTFLTNTYSTSGALLDSVSQPNITVK